MQVIDCDAHIDETEDTWEFLREEELAFKPTTGYPSNPDPTRPPTRYWLIDGHRQPRLHRDDKWSQTTGYQPVPGARIVTRHESTGDLVGVRFPASEIGSPTQSNWIAWNGLYPTWEDVAPDSTVAYWHQ